ncbi:hypothetical protein HKI87_09g58750 [Chloropicon roscoffensis]|uniref:SET domain-containing protein n=1 Tax=Chloropicon roscoffensis TaxID=1461544 RepID=A0AAX4PDR6_9CHLO
MFGPLAGKVKLNHCLIVVAVISVYSVSAGYKEASKPASLEKEPASKPESQDQTPAVQDFRYSNVTSREGLEARPSSVPGAAIGLFTTKALKAGDFLGFYCGRMVPVEKQDEVTDDEWKYAAAVTKRMTVVADTINYPERDKMALVNEAPYPGGKGPNVVALTYDVLHQGQKFSAFTYFVLRGVKADGELFVYYGIGYDVVRKKAGYTQPVRFARLGMKENPQSVLETIPSNCFAEADS